MLLQETTFSAVIYTGCQSMSSSCWIGSLLRPLLLHGAREAQKGLDTCWECVLQYHSLVEGEVQLCSVEERQRIFCFDRKCLGHNLRDKLASLQKVSRVAFLMADFIDLSCDSEHKYIVQAYLSQDVSIIKSSVSVPYKRY